LVGAATSAAKAKGSYFKDKYHRLKARRGSLRAAVAIAHKILVAAFHILSQRVTYHDLGDAYLDYIDVPAPRRTSCADSSDSVSPSTSSPRTRRRTRTHFRSRRHSFGTHAALFGMNPWRLQGWMGHKRIEETMLYVHVADNHRREIPEGILAAGAGQSDPDIRIVQMLRARGSHVAAAPGTSQETSVVLAS
jgi:hypothetical protein